MIGLVLEGGGIRGAYTAGCLAWLNDHHITFDYGVGISSGAVYLCMYQMKDSQLLYKTSTRYAPAKQNTGISAFLKEKHYVAYLHLFKDYLLDQEKWNIQPLIDENPNIEVGAYDLKQGKTIFFSPKDFDLGLDILRATCALPIASAVVEVNGMRLLDGGITTMIPIDRAKEKGCDKFLVITTKPKGYVRKPANQIVRFLMKHLYKECPQAYQDYEVRHINYYKQIQTIQQLVEENQAIHILPSKTISVSRFKGDPEKCEVLYQLGYQDMENRKQEILEMVKHG